MSDHPLRDVIGAHHLATLATIRSNGRPQLSVVSYAYATSTDLVRVSITADRAKTTNLRRDSRATLLVHGDDPWTYAVAEVDALLLPECSTPDDASVEELIDIYRNVRGEHPNWTEFRQAMVDEHRVPLHLKITHVYGTAH